MNMTNNTKHTSNATEEQETQGQLRYKFENMQNRPFTTTEVYEFKRIHDRLKQDLQIAQHIAQQKNLERLADLTKLKLWKRTRNHIIVHDGTWKIKNVSLMLYEAIILKIEESQETSIKNKLYLDIANLIKDDMEDSTFIEEEFQPTLHRQNMMYFYHLLEIWNVQIRSYLKTLQVNSKYTTSQIQTSRPIILKELHKLIFSTLEKKVFLDQVNQIKRQKKNVHDTHDVFPRLGKLMDKVCHMIDDDTLSNLEWDARCFNEVARYARAYRSAIKDLAFISIDWTSYHVTLHDKKLDEIDQEWYVILNDINLQDNKKFQEFLTLFNKLDINSNILTYNLSEHILHFNDTAFHILSDSIFFNEGIVDSQKIKQAKLKDIKGEFVAPNLNQIFFMILLGNSLNDWYVRNLETLT